MKTYKTTGALAEAMGEVVGLYIPFTTKYVFQQSRVSLEIFESGISNFIKAGLIKEVEND